MDRTLTRRPARDAADFGTALPQGVVAQSLELTKNNASGNVRVPAAAPERTGGAMRQREFDVGGALKALTGMVWSEDGRDPVTGMARLRADDDRRYVAEVAADGDRIALSVSPARWDGTPVGMPSEVRDCLTAKGGMRAGLRWRALETRDGRHWRLSFDLRRLEGSGLERFLHATAQD